MRNSIFAKVKQSISAKITILIADRTISKPLRRSNKELKMMIAKIEAGEGDLTARIPVKSNDEIGELSQGINIFYLHSMLQ